MASAAARPPPSPVGAGRDWRRARSTRVGWGNFGAPPKPPHSASNRRSSSATAGVSRSGGPPPSRPSSREPAPGRGLDAPNAAAMAAASSSACSSTSLAPVVPDVGEGVEHGGERGAALEVGGREVGAAVEGAPVGGEEHAHRPAARPGDGLDRLHVDGVDVGALLAVDLDADEGGVEPVGHGRVLEGLVGHDVAPVAGRVPDGQEDRLVLGGGLGERLLAPRVPVDRVVGVLPQVGAGFRSQAVGGGHSVRVPPRPAGASTGCRPRTATMGGIGSRWPVPTNASPGDPDAVGLRLPEAGRSGRHAFTTGWGRWRPAPCRSPRSLPVRRARRRTGRARSGG